MGDLATPSTFRIFTCNKEIIVMKFKDTKVFKLLVERWKGKDMEKYFIEKNEAFHKNLTKKK